ncbi:MAG: Rpn family recombination-promoting nuclease/putative transposase [Leptospirales bacterium]|nr:Rpn family recombination-promoting nuclease/putative transposase [Leptospirales bacterium]
MAINKEYLNTLFINIFSNEERALELFNTIIGTNFKDTSVVEVNAVEDFFSSDIKSALSIEISKKVILLVEHQLVIDEGIAAKMLMYIARIYGKIYDDNGLAYRTKLFKMPRPVFIALYSGKEDFPEEKILIFGDKEFKESAVFLEAKVLNINKGYNTELVSKCKALADYVSFIAKVREYEDKYPLKKAIKSAINYCIDNNILKEYLV